MPHKELIEQIKAKVADLRAGMANCAEQTARWKAEDDAEGNPDGIESWECQACTSDAECARLMEAAVEALDPPQHDHWCNALLGVGFACSCSHGHGL